MSHWQARYDMSKAPKSWVAGRSLTFPVTVTNAGTSSGRRQVTAGWTSSSTSRKGGWRLRDPVLNG